MKAKQLLSIIFLIFASSVNTTSTVDEEHEKFSNEYHKVIRDSLNLVSNTFQGLDYDIKDGKFSMSWSHGSVPTLDFSFSVLLQNEQVCKIEFIIDSFLAHVPEKLQQEESSEQIDAIKQQITQCSENVVNKVSGPNKVTMNEQILKEGSELLNNQSLDSSEEAEVKRAIILNEPVQYQQIWLNEPVTAVHMIEKVTHYIKEKSNLSSEETDKIIQNVIENPSIAPEFQNLNSSESQRREMSNQESQNFEDSSEEDQNHLNKYEDHQNKGIFFVSQTVSISRSHEISSEDDQEVKPSQDNMFNFQQWLKDLSPNLFNTFHYDEIFVIDTEEESSFETDIDENSSEQKNSSEEIEKKNIQTQTEEGHVDNQHDYTCKAIDKTMVKERLRQLHLENQIQDVKVFDENIVRCKRGKGLKIDVILSFNLEECYLGLEGTIASGYRMLSTFDSQNFGIPLNESIKNCVDRLGTQALKTRKN